MTTITPTQERFRLWIKDDRSDFGPFGIPSFHVQDVVTRWLERMAYRQGRHINEPSIYIQIERDPSLRRTFLFAEADSFLDTLPEWLRTAKAVIEPPSWQWTTPA